MRACRNSVFAAFFSAFAAALRIFCVFGPPCEDRLRFNERLGATACGGAAGTLAQKAGGGGFRRSLRASPSAAASPSSLSSPDPSPLPSAAASCAGAERTGTFAEV